MSLHIPNTVIKGTCIAQEHSGNSSRTAKFDPTTFHFPVQNIIKVTLVNNSLQYTNKLPFINLWSVN